MHGSKDRKTLRKLKTLHSDTAKLLREKPGNYKTADTGLQSFLIVLSGTGGEPAALGRDARS